MFFFCFSVVQIFHKLIASLPLSPGIVPSACTVYFPVCVT